MHLLGGQVGPVSALAVVGVCGIGRGEHGDAMECAGELKETAVKITSISKPLLRMEVWSCHDQICSGYLRHENHGSNMFQYSQHCPTRLNTAVPAVLISTYQLHTSAVGMAVGAGLA